MSPHIPFADALATLDFLSVRNLLETHCLTGYGAEHVRQLEPSSVFAEVRDEHLKVREMMSLDEADDPVPLDVLPECREALHRAAIAASVLSAPEMQTIHLLLVTSRRVRAFFGKRTERCPLLSNMAHALFEDKMLEYHIEKTVNEEGEVKDSASRELLHIRRELVERSSQLRRKMENILKRNAEENIVMEEIITMRNGRMVLPVRAEFKRQIQGFVHGASATGQTVYIEPTETLELNNEITDLQFEEQREIARILAALTDKVRPAASQLVANTAIYAEYDSLRARSRFAAALPAAIPILRNAGPLKLFGARHPQLILRKTLREVVPLDFSIGEPETTVLITGPNAGGKSVAMKTTGLLALMVQSGIPVPCSEFSEFPVYTDVLVDIGDEQSVENDLSTFSSHVQRLTRIIEAAGGRTLVLIDEIGTGTDPAEGSALGAAILEHLTATGAHVIATTHHGMLKALAHEHPGMVNSAMEFDLATLQPTYHFRSGLPGSSYAFEITRRHGMRSGIIERARTLLGSATHSLETLLTDVERTSGELATQLREARRERAEAEAMRTEYEQKLADSRREARQTVREALLEAQTLVETANSRIEQTIRELRERGAEKDAINAAKDEVTDIRTELEEQLKSTEPPAPEKPKPSGIVRKGCTVIMIGNPDVQGTVVEEPVQGKAVVVFGSMHTRLPVRQLEVVADAPESPESVSTHFVDNEIRNEIDLRGKYGDEAVEKLDAFLYQAYTAGLKRIDVIHGKGTGALRKRIHAFLKDLPHVESFRLGEWNEGSYGVTVVIMKD